MGAQYGPIVADAIGKLATGFFLLVTSPGAQAFFYNAVVFLGQIGAALPSLQGFLWFANGLLAAFNALPAPVQGAAFALIAFNWALGGVPLMLLVGLVSGLRSLGMVLWGFRLATLAATGVLPTWGATFSAVFGGVLSFLGTVATGIWTFFAVTLPAAAGVGIGPIVAILAGYAASFGYIFGPTGAIVGVLLGIVAFLAGGWVVALVGAVAAGLVALGVALWRNFDTVKRWGGMARGWFNSLPGFLRNALLTGLRTFPLFAPFTLAFESFFAWLSGENLLTNLANMGRNLVSGIANGIYDAARAVWDAIVWVVNEGIRLGWDAIWPGSPSRRTRPMGWNLAEGIAAGMLDAVPLVTSAAGRLVGAAAGGMNFSAPSTPSQRFTSSAPTVRGRRGGGRERPIVVRLELDGKVLDERIISVGWGNMRRGVLSGEGY
jgi:hypothetical protein